MLESKLGVVNGESLADDMEGCGDELVLKRVCAPGGEGPKETGETIRSRVLLVGLAIGRERRALNEWECSGLVDGGTRRGMLLWQCLSSARSNAGSGKQGLSCTPACQC